MTIYIESAGLTSESPPTPEISHYGFIFIRSHGNIEPSEAPIRRNGDVYSFTGRGLYERLRLLMPMKDRAQAHTGTLASKSCFREQMPSENIRFYPRQFRG